MGESGLSSWSRDTFSRLQVYEYVWNSFISVVKKTQKGLQMHLMAVKKSRKRSGFVIYSYLKDSAFTAVERGAKY